jgi:putative ABC transport system permease protein
MLAALDAMHREMGMAVQVLSLFTLATGFVILIAAAAAARSERRREALLLRTLGASSQTVRRIIVTEAVALGALAASVGAVLATLAAWAAVVLFFELPFDPPLLDLAALALATTALSALLGAGGGGARSRSPFAALREAETHGAT